MTEVREADLRRLGRAIHLDVTGMGPGLYRVSGGAEPHTVQKQPEGWSCDCADAAYGCGWCKHVLAVGLANGDRKVRRALRLLIPQPERAAR